MPLRLIEVVVPERVSTEIKQALEDHEFFTISLQAVADGSVLAKIVLDAGHAEPVINTLTKKYGEFSEFSLIMMPVLARLPKEENGDNNNKDEENEKHERLSRDELHQDLTDASRISGTHTALLVFATLIAAIGILENSSTIIIGAMVIAPLFAPAVALSLANILADRFLAFNVVKLVLADILVITAISWTIGWTFGIDQVTKELSMRTSVGLADVITALASGAAGVLGLAAGLASALVGVMVAVALLPPLVSVGLLLGAGMTALAWKAMLLFLTNFICINFTGIVTLWILGIRPSMEKDQVAARKYTAIAFLVWTLFLGALVLAIIASQHK